MARSRIQPISESYSQSLGNYFAEFGHRFNGTSNPRYQHLLHSLIVKYFLMHLSTKDEGYLVHIYKQEGDEAYQRHLLVKKIIREKINLRDLLTLNEEQLYKQIVQHFPRKLLTNHPVNYIPTPADKDKQAHAMDILSSYLVDLAMGKLFDAEVTNSEIDACMEDPANKKCKEKIDEVAKKILPLIVKKSLEDTYSLAQIQEKIEAIPAPIKQHHVALPLLPSLIALVESYLDLDYVRSVSDKLTDWKTAHPGKEKYEEPAYICPTMETQLITFLEEHKSNNPDDMLLLARQFDAMKEKFRQDLYAQQLKFIKKYLQRWLNWKIAYRDQQYDHDYVCPNTAYGNMVYALPKPNVVIERSRNSSQRPYDMKGNNAPRTPSQNEDKNTPSPTSPNYSPAKKTNNLFARANEQKRKEVQPSPQNQIISLSIQNRVTDKIPMPTHTNVLTKNPLKWCAGIVSSLFTLTTTFVSTLVFGILNLLFTVPNALGLSIFTQGLKLPFALIFLPEMITNSVLQAGPTLTMDYFNKKKRERKTTVTRIESPIHTMVVSSPNENSCSRRESKASYSPSAARSPNSVANVRTKLNIASHQRHRTHLQVPLPGQVEMTNVVNTQHSSSPSTPRIASLGDEKYPGRRLSLLEPAPPMKGQVVNDSSLSPASTPRARDDMPPAYDAPEVKPPQYEEAVGGVPPIDLSSISYASTGLTRSARTAGSLRVTVGR